MRNRLLQALSQQELQDAANGFEHVKLELKQVLYKNDEPIAQVYFVTNGVVSLVNEPSPGQIVEFATVGFEGMVGLPLVLGMNSMPSRAFVQIQGEGFRLPASSFKRLMDRHQGFRAVLMRYTLALLTQVAQITSCNRLHEVQERCARWLLQTHDRVDSDKYPITQEFLGQMLGVQRPSVMIAARMLQEAGMISYSQGIMTIRDRQALEEASCECYRTIKAEYDRLLARSETVEG